MEIWLEEGREAGLYMAADVPFWLPRLDMPAGNGKVSSWMLERFDSLTIMAYRDNSDSIYESSKRLLSQADKLGKPIVIGLELGKTNEGGYLSFHGKSARCEGAWCKPFLLHRSSDPSLARVV
ncbi:hypothetical protein AZ66_17090 [Paenibacillus sp. E194]|uniref:hypothetical protein n=1 Tax=Paenibacillus sp. E194 TaxID=1458845 RepID=UPI0005DE5005|nr:hypothetical protein [Paenibacillus sp. E194]KJB86750.1 hypothetical protein AZ66_17090 [Paenibacillus sp. E194]